MSKKRSSGNGASSDGIVPPLSDEEFAEIVAQFNKRGLPVILYVFAGPDSLSASRLLQNPGPRQMAAAATELDEWSRVITRQAIAALQGGGVVKPSIILPKNLKAQGQG